MLIHHHMDYNLLVIEIQAVRNDLKAFFNFIFVFVLLFMLIKFFANKTFWYWILKVCYMPWLNIGYEGTSGFPHRRYFRVSGLSFLRCTVSGFSRYKSDMPTWYGRGYKHRKKYEYASGVIVIRI